jgi:hypothetical protein
MSVAGYLGANRPRVRVRKEGEGELEAATKQRPPDGESLPGGLMRAGHRDVFYERVEDYDPVLRSHCRLE